MPRSRRNKHRETRTHQNLIAIHDKDAPARLDIDDLFEIFVAVQSAACSLAIAGYAQTQRLWADSRGLDQQR